jgi:hypothetical protein
MQLLQRAAEQAHPAAKHALLVAADRDGAAELGRRTLRHEPNRVVSISPSVWAMCGCGCGLGLMRRASPAEVALRRRVSRSAVVPYSASRERSDSHRKRRESASVEPASTTAYTQQRRVSSRKRARMSTRMVTR